jgi:hypothetical protein
MVHPIALFNVPILGSGMTITKLFELGQATGAGSVGLDGYDWGVLGTVAGRRRIPHRGRHDQGGAPLNR